MKSGDDDRLTKVQQRIARLRARAMGKPVKHGRNVLMFERRRGPDRRHPEARPGAFLADPNGQLLFVNDQYQKLVGCDFVDVLGVGWLSFVDDDARDVIQDQWSAHIQTRQPFTLKLPMRRPIDDAVIMVVIRVMPLLTPAGQIVSFAGLLTRADAGDDDQLRPREAAEAVSRTLLSPGSLGRVASDFG